MNSTYTETFSVSIERDLKTNQIVREVWRDDLHRPHRGHDLPAIVTYDMASQKPVQLEFWFHGLQSRRNGPAIEVIDPETGVVVQEEWIVNGDRHRVDGPAIICRNAKSGDVVHAEHHIDERRRPQTPTNEPLS